GILDGLSLIQRKGYQKVVIHTDNLELWKIKHIPREKNQVADRIAKMATEKSTDMQ
ncbi:hypothetical protein Goklo_001148, partial [Gossypium klotzschianum]|nr:hypothetical protein [Gossypium klotzschianum]